jgi:hypothetical protein
MEAINTRFKRGDTVFLYKQGKKIPHMVSCRYCDGSGCLLTVISKQPRQCPHCNGKKEILEGETYVEIIVPGFVEEVKIRVSALGQKITYIIKDEGEFPENKLYISEEEAKHPLMGHSGASGWAGHSDFGGCRCSYFGEERNVLYKGVIIGHTVNYDTEMCFSENKTAKIVIGLINNGTNFYLTKIKKGKLFGDGKIHDEEQKEYTLIKEDL